MIGKPMNSTPALEECDVTHEKMMELEPLLEASGERNLSSIKLTNRECPCLCLGLSMGKFLFSRVGVFLVVAFKL